MPGAHAGFNPPQHGENQSGGSPGGDGAHPVDHRVDPPALVVVGAARQDRGSPAARGSDQFEDTTVPLHDGFAETRHRAERDLAESFTQLIGPGGPAGTQHQRQVDAVHVETGVEELDCFARHFLGVIAHAPSVVAGEPKDATPGRVSRAR